MSDITKIEWTDHTSNPWWGCSGTLLRQCRQPGVSTVPFVKQLGTVAGHRTGSGPKGGDWEQWPEDLKVREFPRT